VAITPHPLIGFALEYMHWKALLRDFPLDGVLSTTTRDTCQEEASPCVGSFGHPVEKVVLPSVLIEFTYKSSRGAGSGLGEATCSGSAWSAPGAQMHFADAGGAPR
jgi:hypothetical protein